MKKIAVLLLGLVTLVHSPVFAQHRSAPPAAAAEAERKLARFDLDFAGGTPHQLVAEIQKALGRPLNAIVAPEHANHPLPALKMKGVNTAELFRALSLASMRREVRAAGSNSWTQVQVSYGFRNTDSTVSDDSIWYFFTEGDDAPKSTRFYLLTPYLDAGLTVDDITTALRTGWKMRGESTAPTLSFHKETKLLIATAEAGSLSLIDDVLRALEPLKAKAAPAPAAAAKAGEERKAER